MVWMRVTSLFVYFNTKLFQHPGCLPLNAWYCLTAWMIWMAYLQIWLQLRWKRMAAITRWRRPRFCCRQTSWNGAGVSARFIRRFRVLPTSHSNAARINEVYLFLMLLCHVGPVSGAPHATQETTVELWGLLSDWSHSACHKDHALSG